jgi:3-oxoacyl-[acyl-carrier-protein] synthase-3
MHRLGNTRRALTAEEAGAYIPEDNRESLQGLPVKPVINGIGAYLPPRIVTNDELAQIVDTSDEWIYSHTGIKARRIAEDSVAASDLALRASEQAIERSAVPREKIDLLLLATSTPDFPGLPATASIVQDRLGIPAAGAMDLVAACSGFVYGLETARAYVLSGVAQNVLVIGAEVYSQILNWKDRSTCVLFGDGAGAAIVSGMTEAEADSRGILGGYLRSKGSGYHTLLRKAGGSRNTVGPENEDDRYLSMMAGRCTISPSPPSSRRSRSS